jgi:hypothetical protein
MRRLYAFVLAAALIDCPSARPARAPYEGESTGEVRSDASLGGSVVAPNARPAPDAFASVSKDAPAFPSSLYGFIEYFEWTEQYDGQQLIRESGPIFGVGGDLAISTQGAIGFGFRGKLFIGEVDYNGGIQTPSGTIPYRSKTTYVGSQAEALASLRLDVGPTVVITPVGELICSGGRCEQRSLQPGGLRRNAGVRPVPDSGGYLPAQVLRQHDRREGRGRVLASWPTPPVTCCRERRPAHSGSPPASRAVRSSGPTRICNAPRTRACH